MSWRLKLMKVGVLRLALHLPLGYTSCGSTGLTESSRLHAYPVISIVCDIVVMSFSALIFRSQLAIIA